MNMAASSPMTTHCGATHNSIIVHTYYITAILYYIAMTSSGTDTLLILVRVNDVMMMSYKH